VQSGQKFTRKYDGKQDGKIQRNRVGDRTVCTSERYGGRESSVQARIDTGMEMVEIAEKNLLDN
jgi:hypothetical protein